MKKREHWLDDILPSYLQNEFHFFDDLKTRELTIVISAMMDSALEEMLKKRFVDNQKIINSIFESDSGFLNSFSSKIKCSYLLGLLRYDEYSCLDGIRKIRNVFAHHVIINFNDKEILKNLKQILDQWKTKKSKPDVHKEFEDFILNDCNEEKICFVLRVVVSTFQYTFTKKLRTIKSLEEAKKYFSGDLIDNSEVL